MRGRKGDRAGIGRGEGGKREGRKRVEGERNKRTAYKNFWFSSAFRWKRTVAGACSVAEGGDEQLDNDNEFRREEGERRAGEREKKEEGNLP